MAVMEHSPSVGPNLEQRLPAREDSTSHGGLSLSSDSVEETSASSATSSLSLSALMRRARGNSKAMTGAQQRVCFDTRSLMSERVDAEISKRYDIDKREIGVGGYGKVFIAKDRMFKDRRVAIKKVVKMDEENSATILKEVNVMKELDHPSICRLFETYDQGRKMFFVLEYCEGGDLFDRFADCGRLSELEVASIVKQVASALWFAHSRGIAHRDLKLENICFCSQDPKSTQVKVIDWGLAGYFKQGRMKSNVGTSTYTAPEVLDPIDGEAEGYTCACDLWSLGVVAYVALSGKQPFWGGHKQMIHNMRSKIYPMTGPIWDPVSLDAKDLIGQMLQPDVQARVTAASALGHPWLKFQEAEPNLQVVAQVLSNLEQFSRAPDFYSLCVASVARQLDHGSLDGIREVFTLLDKNCDGALDLSEVKDGFALAFRDASEAVSEAEVQEIFDNLDLDGTGRITYTEFCAAGLGEASYTEENVLWAAFKTFDIHDDGRISRQELQQVLFNADVKKVWTTGVCEEVAQEVMAQFGGGNDSINFQEWLALMRQSAVKHEESSPKRFREMPGESSSYSLQSNSGGDLAVMIQPRQRSASDCFTCCGAGLIRLLSGKGAR
ncbi:unnamed protein product [Polarella glacialis]|uniref:non-specific serine/threonine protein kinase n=1 Tax=Polarella glacialis TaxID=89957 RepID=A0A813LCA0_POLGL|nr:unnamed protein product [Polarella glacialis]CAE8723970.1 unnamed protein product [Polarella glacialis]